MYDIPDALCTLPLPALAQASLSKLLFGAISMLHCLHLNSAVRPDMNRQYFPKHSVKWCAGTLASTTPSTSTLPVRCSSAPLIARNAAAWRIMMPAAICNLHAMAECRSGLSAVLACRQHSACCGHGEQLRHMVVWLPSAADSLALSHFPARSPYHYGFITELKAVGSGFAYENVKHYTMGRISHEMGCVSVAATLYSCWHLQPHQIALRKLWSTRSQAALYQRWRALRVGLLNVIRHHCLSQKRPCQILAARRRAPLLAASTYELRLTCR